MKEGTITIAGSTGVIKLNFVEESVFIDYNGWAAETLGCKPIQFKFSEITGGETEAPSLGMRWQR